MNNKIIKNIPNALTISRIIASLSGAVAFVLGNIPLATGLYLYGAVSDFFDGFAARKLNAFSEFGRKLDALSDKLYAVCLLVPSILCGNLLMLIPLWLEFKISKINLKSQKFGFKAETQRIGKFKTALLFPTMIIGLLSTVSVKMYPLLWILIPLTTILQTKSITVYENLFNYNVVNKDVVNSSKKENIDSLENISKNKSINVSKNNANKGIISNNDYYFNSMNLMEEFAFYIMTPYFKQEYDTLDNNKSYVKSKRRLK